MVIESLSGLEANALWKCGDKSVDKTVKPKSLRKLIILCLLSASSDITKTESKQRLPRKDFSFNKKAFKLIILQSLLLINLSVPRK